MFRLLENLKHRYYLGMFGIPKIFEIMSLSYDIGDSSLVLTFFPMLALIIFFKFCDVICRAFRFQIFE